LRVGDHVACCESVHGVPREAGGRVSDLSDYAPIVGKTVASIGSTSGWPVILFTDGTGLCLMDEWGTAAPVVEFMERVPVGYMDSVPGVPDP
jgi:hypothetical protein